ncbi:MAG TPA: hypothetical protein VGV09_17250 [Steroidobacteraceae bacterium]|nr:hypothetical protein [Steroidobacteraceae bacterium]
MSKHATPTRRMFLKGGALLAAPMAAASVGAMALAHDRSDDAMKARLTRLEDEAAIREVHQSLLRQINAGRGMTLPGGFVTRVMADHAGGADRIEIGADGLRATGRFDCVVDLESPLPADSTLGQMAHAQGSGTLRTTGRLVLKVDYLKVADAWTIQKVASQAA